MIALVLFLRYLLVRPCERAIWREAHRVVKQLRTKYTCPLKYMNSQPDVQRLYYHWKISDIRTRRMERAFGVRR